MLIIQVLPNKISFTLQAPKLGVKIHDYFRTQRIS